MDRKIWRLLCTAVRSADRSVVRCGRRPRFCDQRIVKMYLWSVWHDRPLCWACDREHYNTMFRPKQLPSVSQFCRRMKTLRVQAMLEAIHDYLTRNDVPIRLSFLDGKPLPVATAWKRCQDDFFGIVKRQATKGKQDSGDTKIILTPFQCLVAEERTMVVTFAQKPTHDVA